MLITVAKKIRMQNRVAKPAFVFVCFFCCRPGDDWKKTLKLPPKDLRIKTSVRMLELQEWKLWAKPQ